MRSGTLDYFSPEVNFEFKINSYAKDLYGVGCILYEMLTRSGNSAVCHKK
jgi:serine/threonine protein kinase